MPKKRYTPEEIVAKMRQVDVLIGQSKALGEALKSIEVTDTTYHRWRNEYGGLNLDQMKRLKEVEAENTQLVSNILTTDTDGGRSGRRLLRPRATSTSI
jgi:hypothetical protein